jgi:hypothetical protein
MAIKIVIHGGHQSGKYIVECECGMNWEGRGIVDALLTFSPALPIAESVVHMKLAHPVELLDVRFTEAFKGWLQKYWEVASLRGATEVFQPSRARV